MRFVDTYIKKCLENKSYFRKSSVIAGFILSFITFLMNIFSKQDIKISIITLLVMWGIFSGFWFFLVRQLEKTFRKQDEMIEQERSTNRSGRREKARMNMKKIKKQK